MTIKTPENYNNMNTKPGAFRIINLTLVITQKKLSSQKNNIFGTPKWESITWCQHFMLKVESVD